MKPFTKRLLGLGGGLVSALVLVALAVLLFCDLSSLRGRIERNVSSTLNREVTIAGDIRLMPMLPPRVELEDVRVSAGISSPGDDLARMGSVQVTLSTAHLMRATVILEHIQVSNFELFAVREADGLWRLPMPAADDLDDGVLASVVLQDGTVKLIDHASAREHQLEISTLDLEFSDAQLESRFAGALDGHRLDGRLQADSLSTLSGESPWQFALEIDALRWALSAEGARESPTVWQGHIETETESVGAVSNLLGVALPSLGPFQALADVRYDLGGARVSNFELHARSTDLRGHAQLDLTRDRPVLDVSVTSDSVDVGHWMNAAPMESGGALSALLDKDLPLTFLAGLGLDVAAQVAVDSVLVDEHQLGPVNVKAFSSSASAGLQGSIDLWGGRLDGHVNTLQLLHNNQSIDVEVELQGPAFELDIVGTVERPVQFDRATFSAEFAGEHAEHIGILIGVPEWVNGPFSGQGQISIENGQVQVSALELAVAETDIKGDIRFPFRDPGVVNGNLHSERVSVPDLWEPATQSDEDEGAEFVIPALALGELASLHRSVALDWQIDRLWLAASSYRDVNSSISISNGVMDLRISGTTNHTDGRFSLVFTHDPDRARSGELNASGESFDFGWLLPDTGLGKPRWPADYDVILTGPGERLDLFLGDADGEIHFISGPTDGAEFKR
ncbi:MAG: hypothetical protein CMO26_08850 [Thiotrichales bacterium]|nr:hypothetical protein [Thiotrichales bacterium]